MRTEFDFIYHIKEKYGLKNVGDDCAVLPKDDSTDQVVTADLLVEDIDFRQNWTTPELLGQKALAVSLSDIAAMGGRPKWAMLSVGVTEAVWDSDYLDRFHAGWHKMAALFGVELVGGDISRTPEKIVIDSIVGGEVQKGRAILRSGAKPGDRIYVSGRLGGAAGGLILLSSGATYSRSSEAAKRLITRQIRPEPRIELASRIADNEIATSMIDVSDGLSADLAHICQASDVGADLLADAIPVDTDLGSIALSVDEMVGMAIGGGEDFELLFTVPTHKVHMLGHLDVTDIGEINAKSGVVEIVDQDGNRFTPPSGFRHF